MSVAERLVERSLSERQRAITAEMREIIEATYRVIGATGRLDPPIRAILSEAGLSNPAFYRHFSGKDELLLVMLDEGRRQLVAYLEHRTSAVDGVDERVAAWVRGVLAQAGDADAARRTRPFVTDIERLHQEFPREQEASERQLIDQLAGLLDDRSDWAPTIYTLVFAELGRHLRAESAPSEADVERVVGFALAGSSASPTGTAET